jgi:hypothetical protein
MPARTLQTEIALLSYLARFRMFLVIGGQDVSSALWLLLTL